MMGVANFRKETSERSDELNWAKKLLIKNTGYYFDSIEGCNQNERNVVTHLMERARVDIVPGTTDAENVINQITTLEGKDVLQRKLNFANSFKLPLTYVLYCDEKEIVFVFDFLAIDKIGTVTKYNSYQDFSNWIKSIKGWVSKKKFREDEDLPEFDKRLRKAGTAWPTNIDCFISDKSNKPIAILEFQNAKKTKVLNHCNNDYFLYKKVETNQWGYPDYPDSDVRRWTSQEILRVQSSLRFFIITWSASENDSILKELDVVTMPHFPKTKDGKPDWKIINPYKKDMHDYTEEKSDERREKIEDNYQTFNFEFHKPNMDSIINNPPLSLANKTFPHLYYKSKEPIRGDRMELVQKFIELLKK